ncbi:sensor histidine kinase [Parabacteroides bouchesdurhonensis]|uniref:sensor histidine kinase n=1 Tax=Parabacteroides bouchesdurhonensis TaxID=1936995 RepID=UPI000C8685BD|nr:ATP-binding protein [Parabacteroides bouchesdurhonensis]
MGSLYEEIKTLQVKIKRLERSTTIGLIAFVAVIIAEAAGVNRLGGWVTPTLAVFLIVVQVYKSRCRKKLKQKELLAKEVEVRTEEIRSERDAVQEESQKLATALSALAEAQDELVQQERMATVGQLTKGLVDRILNPLNYINNFSCLSATLIKDLRENLDKEKDHLSKEVYDDSMELLDMMNGNLNKISEHGFNTVRIVKAMEELLKDRRGNTTLTDINNLCRITLDKLKRNYEKDIEEKNIRIVFDGLTLSVMMEVCMEQLSNVLLGLLQNAMYAVLKKAEKVTFSPEIYMKLRVEGDKLQITIRDNGIGISDNIKERIFSPFFTTKPTGEAAGIGLYLCREVVYNHKGTIEVNSEQGEYTEFLINIPVYQPHPATPENDEDE